MTHPTKTVQLSQTMVVTDYHNKRTIENTQKKGTMKFQKDGSVVQVSSHVNGGQVII